MYIFPMTNRPKIFCFNFKNHKNLIGLKIESLFFPEPFPIDDLYKSPYPSSLLYNSTGLLSLLLLPIPNHSTPPSYLYVQSFHWLTFLYHYKVCILNSLFIPWTLLGQIYIFFIQFVVVIQQGFLFIMSDLILSGRSVNYYDPKLSN